VPVPGTDAFSYLRAETTSFHLCLGRISPRLKWHEDFCARPLGLWHREPLIVENKRNPIFFSRLFQNVDVFVFLQAFFSSYTLLLNQIHRSFPLLLLSLCQCSSRIATCPFLSPRATHFPLPTAGQFHTLDINFSPMKTLRASLTRTIEYSTISS